MSTILRILVLVSALLGVSPAFASCTGQFLGGTICGNNTALQGIPGPTANPVLGVPGINTGTLGFAGSGSGTVFISAQTAAGAATLLLPTTSGTFADGASSPLVLSATTGNLTCPTCLTSSSGGTLTASAPLNITASNLSLQGATGTIATGSGGTGTAFTATPVLGVPTATQGTLGFAGLTSGTATITAQAIAGTPTITLPNTAGTLADGASAPLVLSATTGNLTCPTCATSTLNTAALTAANDTNVTLTLGGTPTTALLNAASITAGWTGTLAVARGGTAGSVASGTLLDNITGFASTGFLTRTGAGTYAFQSTTNGITNANLVQGAAATLKGNPTAALANEQDFTIQGLTNLPTANATLDFLLIFDHVSGTFKNVTPTGLGSGVSAGNNITIAAAVVSGSSYVPEGRLTLTTHTPVMSASVAATSTVFYDATPGGGSVPYWNGTNDAIDTITANEVSTVMQTSSTGVINAAQVVDVWWEGNTNHKICIATNGTGGGWASDTGGSNTTRGTGYSQIDNTTRPYLTNTNAVAHCYNGATDYGSIAANKLTYLGTLLTIGAGQVSFVNGTVAAGGGQAIFNLWNAYQQKRICTTVSDSTASWTYAVTGTWRAPNGNATMRASYVSGLIGDSFSGSYKSIGVATSGTNAGAAGTGYDSTTAFSGTSDYMNLTGQFSVGGNGFETQSVGSHFMSAIEYTQAGTMTFYGTAAQPFLQSGFKFCGSF